MKRRRKRNEIKWGGGLEEKQQNHGQLRVINCFLLFTPYPIPFLPSYEHILLTHNSSSSSTLNTMLWTVGMFCVLSLIAFGHSIWCHRNQAILQMNNSLRFHAGTALRIAVNFKYFSPHAALVDLSWVTRNSIWPKRWCFFLVVNVRINKWNWYFISVEKKKLWRTINIAQRNKKHN